MKIQSYKPNGIHIMSAVIGLLFLSTAIMAQTKIPYSHNSTSKYIDIKVDGTYPFLYLEAKGGDGGCATDKRKQGGGGAFISGYISIGDGTNDIPAGSIIRFIPGEAGASYGKYGGGGGGAAIAVKMDDEWKLLIVAGGGGGATFKQDGREGNVITSGSNGKDGSGNITKNDKNAGSQGKGGDEGNNGGAGGGGAFGDGKCSITKDCEPFNGKSGMNPYDPTGSEGGRATNKDQSKTAAGGFGFGSGGAGKKSDSFSSGGGGGGYSGGGGGIYNGPGGGGGSYYHPSLLKSVRKQTNGTIKPSIDGYVLYQYRTTSPNRNIKIAANPRKCLDDNNGSTHNGTNIQTRDCNHGVSQAWYFQHTDRSIRLIRDYGKCLNLAGNNTTNGNNINLQSCNHSDAQRWIYDGINKSIRNNHNPEKCLDINGTYSDLFKDQNVVIGDCTNNTDQAWEVERGFIAPEGAKYIVPAGNIQLAVHSHTYKEVGSNIQLWTKTSTNDAETWYFDGMQIKMKSDKGLCIDLKSNNHNAGTNIQLWTCSGGDAQKWIYDGMTQNIRLAANPDKCMEVKESDYEKRTNIQLGDCNGSQRQQFLIVE